MFRIDVADSSIPGAKIGVFCDEKILEKGLVTGYRGDGDRQTRSSEAHAASWCLHLPLPIPGFQDQRSVNSSAIASMGCWAALLTITGEHTTGT